jgi:hypothetical protein
MRKWEERLVGWCIAGAGDDLKFGRDGERLGRLEGEDGDVVRWWWLQCSRFQEAFKLQ